MEDQNPELDSASGGAEDLELEPEAELPKEELPKDPSGDPLDDIVDEAARAEAKKHRAIARRQDEKPVPAEAKPAVSTQEYLTKADFFKSNERKAITEATADPEIKAAWNDIIPFYTPRRGKATPEDITEDIKDAITLYRARNPVVETDDSASELTATPVVKTGGGIVDKATPKSKDPPNFKLPSDTKDWYPKKS